MDPLNDERTNVMTERVGVFHESCVKVNAQTAAVIKRETKASMHYLKWSENFAKMSQGEQNKSLKATLKSLADALNEVQAHRESFLVSRIQSLQQKLRELDETCNAPTAVLLKDRNTSVRSSIKFKDQFETLASKATSQHKLDRKRAQLEDEEKRVYTIDRGLQKNLLKYEAKRIKECKAMLLDFIKGQLLFHCRAVESFSSALKVASRLDESQGVEQLCNDLHISAKQFDLN